MSTRKATSSTVRKTDRANETFDVAETLYRTAMTLYVQKRDFAKAATAFETFLEKYGEERDVAEIADRARIHLAGCRDRLAAPPPPPSSAADVMLHAVIAANAGRVDDALALFSQARDRGVDPGRVHYASAAALALAERHDESLEELARAIEADPSHRAHSLGDPDFEQLRETAGYVALVDPPRPMDGPDLGFPDDFDDDEDEDQDGDQSALETIDGANEEDQEDDDDTVGDDFPENPFES